MNLLKISTSCIIGILLSVYTVENGINIPLWNYIIIISASVLLAVLSFLKKSSKVTQITIIVLGFTLGLVVGVVNYPDKKFINIPTDGTFIEAKAVLQQRAGLPANGYSLPVLITEIKSDEQIDFTTANFQALVFTDGLIEQNRSHDEFIIGDVYKIEGKFSKVENRKYVGYVNSEIVQLVSTSDNFLQSGLSGVGNAISRSLVESLNSEVGGLASAMLTGQRVYLDRDLADNFRKSGLSHIVAISGLHIGIIALMVIFVLNLFIGKRFKLYIPITIAIVWLYILLANFPNSAVRAGIIVSAILFSQILGRTRHSISILFFAAAAMLLVNPVSYEDVGFQLSFAAVFGIMVMYPKVANSKTIEKLILQDKNVSILIKKPLDYVVKVLILSLSAVALTFPIVISTFGELSLISPLSTLFVLILLPVFLFFSVFQAFVSLIFPQISGVLGVPTTIIGEYIIFISSIFANIPTIQLQNEMDILYPSIIYYLLLIGAFYGKSFTIKLFISAKTIYKTVNRVPKVAKFALVGLAIICTLLAVFTYPQNSIRIVFFDVGLGDMILIESPKGKQLIIDGGRSEKQATELLENYLPFWDNSVDIVLATHPDADHIGGLPLIVERYNPDIIIDSVSTRDTNISKLWSTKVEGHDRSVKVQSGLSLDLGGGLFATIYWPDENSNKSYDANSLSTVLLLEYGQFSALFTGDIEADSEIDVIAQGDLKVDLLKVAHHGSKTSSTTQFLENTSPKYAVIMANKDNRFDHPHDEVVTRISDYVGSEGIFTIADTGTITFTVKNGGEKVEIKTER